MTLCNQARTIVHLAEPAEAVQPTGAFWPSRPKQGSNPPFTDAACRRWDSGRRGGWRRRLGPVAPGVEPRVRKHRRTMGKLVVRSVVSEEVEVRWSMASHSRRKKWSEMEPYPASWPVAQARSCCYTFNRKQRCGHLTRTVTELDGVVLDGEPRGGQERGRAESERQKQCRRKERGGNPPQCRIRAAPAWVVVATGSDRCLCALRRECGHCCWWSLSQT
jgi:hypothetical protein